MKQTHGMTKSPEYICWQGMKARCHNPNCTGYRLYGGRGIRVCDQWLNGYGFERFYADMGAKPSSAHSIDRIDNNLGYSPENCRWVTMEEQHANKRPRGWTKVGTSVETEEEIVKRIAKRKVLRISEAAEYLGVHQNTLRNWGRSGIIQERRHPMSNYRLYKKSELDVLKRRRAQKETDKRE